MDAISHQELYTFLKGKKTNFIDSDFPPLYESLYNHLTCPEYPFKNAVHFKRPSEWLQGEVFVFLDGINPHDIRGGELQDQYFLSALQIISENEKLVERLFESKEYNETGFYKVKLCKDGQWQHVTVDDYFPCYVNGGPIFTFGEGNELWVMLLEKAYAKLFGSY